MAYGYGSNRSRRSGSWSGRSGSWSGRSRRSGSSYGRSRSYIQSCKMSFGRTKQGHGYFQGYIRSAQAFVRLYSDKDKMTETANGKGEVRYYTRMVISPKFGGKARRVNMFTDDAFQVFTGSGFVFKMKDSAGNPRLYFRG